MENKKLPPWDSVNEKNEGNKSQTIFQTKKEKKSTGNHE
jgi:hypothetical protein